MARPPLSCGRFLTTHIMSQEIIQNKPEGGLIEWLNMKQAAELLDLTESSVYSALRRHKDIKEKYCTMMKGEMFRKSLHITKKGLEVLFNAKDTGGRRSSLAIITPEITKKAKQAIAEKAQEGFEASNDPMLAQPQVLMNMRREMLGMKEELAETREAIGLQTPKIENHEERIGLLEEQEDPMTGKMTPSQQQFLNLRVREYAINQGYTYSEVWRWLHTMVGRKNLKHYVRHDYYTAIGLLKSKYKQAMMSW